MKRQRKKGLRKHIIIGAIVSMAALPLGTKAGIAATADATSVDPWGLDTAAGRCVVCHSLEQGGPFRYAPNLYGIVGAEKARDRQWYGYSLALMKMSGTWTESDLDAYLENASKFAPGSTKSIRIANEEERREIIDFLKTLSP
jgi:cytochrome c